MKKHLLGLAIFSFIVASFAALFAFWYAPKTPQISRIEEVRQPVFENDRRYRCNKKSESIKFEVLSTQYNLDEKKLISKIKMTLGDVEKVPKKVEIWTDFFTPEGNKENKFQVEAFVIENFEMLDEMKGEGIFQVESRLISDKKMNRKNNFYVYFSYFVTNQNNFREILQQSEAKSVLFVHGESSVIKK